MSEDFIPFDEFDQDAKFPHLSSRKIGVRLDFSGVKTLTAGEGIIIDATDPENLVIAFSGDILGSFNIYMQSFLANTGAASARAALGITDLGTSLVTANNTAAIFNLLEATVLGTTIFKAVNDGAVHTALGGSVLGVNLYKSADQAAARTALDVPSNAEVSFAISDAIAGIIFPAAPVTSVAGKTGVVTLNNTDVGLDQVDNTADVNKPVSIAQANADADVLAQSKAYTDLLALLVTGQITFNQNKYLNGWTTKTSAADNQWQSIAWSDSMLMTAAVSSDGTNRVMVSTDGGEAWTSYLVGGTAVALYSICAGPGKFVAVGDGGYVISTNGTTWTGYSAFSTDIMNSVIYSAAAGLYVAVGNNGKVYTSTNGTAWTSRISGVSTNLNAVVYSTTLNRFVAGGDSEVIYSTDGITWLQANSGLPGTWSAVTWAAELNKFFAISQDGKCMSSTDGSTWAAITMPSTLTSASWTGIAWSGTTLVLVGTDSNNGAIASSVDGITWVNRTSTDTAKISYKDVIWNSSLNQFLATGDGRNGYDIAVSSSGSSWSFINIPTITGHSSHNWGAIEFGSGGGVIVIDRGSRYATSVDGITWTRSTVNLAHNATDVVWSPSLNLWLVTFLDQNADVAVATSPDAVTWTVRDIGTGNPISLWSAEWNSTDSLFLISSSSSIYTSPDGTTWTKRTITSPGVVEWSALTYSAALDLYVAVGTDEVAISNNGTAWTRLAPPSIPVMKGIAHSNTKFVSVGSGNAAISNDGIEWTPVTVPVANTWESVVWSNPLGVFVAVASTGTSTNRVMSSPDGVTWTLRISASGNNWKDVAWLSSYDRFVAVAASGTGTRVMATA